MAGFATPCGGLTVEEYLKLEEGASVKHEYVAMLCVKATLKPIPI